MDPKKWEGCQWESKRILCTATVYEKRVEGVAQAKHWEEREEAMISAGGRSEALQPWSLGDLA